MTRPCRPLLADADFGVLSTGTRPYRRPAHVFRQLYTTQLGWEVLLSTLPVKTYWDVLGAAAHVQRV
jgi:hypothetical protein